MKTFKLTIVREAGHCPIMGTQLPAGSETLTIKAKSLEEAHNLSAVYQTLQFRGQQRRVFAEDGTELFGNF